MERAAILSTLGSLILLAPGCESNRISTSEAELTLCVCDGECPEEVSDCLAGVPTLQAGGQLTQWRVFVPKGTSGGKDLTVTTSLGQLSPGSTPSNQVQLKTQGDRPLDFSLLLDTTPGEGFLRVSGEGLEADTVFDVAELRPCLRLVRTPHDVCMGTAPETEDDADPYQACLDAEGPVEFEASGGTAEFEVVLPAAGLTDPIAQTVTLGSTLAPLRRQASGQEQFTLDVSVVPGVATSFLVDTGRTTGLGQLSAQLGMQSASVLPYEVTAATDRLEVDAPQEIFDDGRTYEFSVTLASSAVSGPQTVDLLTTRGTLSSDAATPGATSVEVEPCESVTVGLTTGADQRGRGTFTASLTGGIGRTPVDFDILPTSSTLVFQDPPEDDAYLADDVTVVQIELASTSTRLDDRTIQIESQLNDINPSNASSPKSLPLSIGPNETVTVNLSLGRHAGLEVLTARDGGLIADSIQFDVARSRPDALSISGPESVLSSQNTSTTVSVDFWRLDERPVSHGTRVYFEACCPDDDLTDGCEYVEVSASEQASESTPTQIDNVAVSLTPSGNALVAEQGMPPDDNIPVSVFAFVLGPGDLLPKYDCGQLLTDGLSVAAIDEQLLELQRMPTP